MLRGNVEDPALYGILVLYIPYMHQYFETKNRKKNRGHYTTVATILLQESRLVSLSDHSRAHNTSKKVELCSEWS